MEIGEGVTNLNVGDNVALEPGITCGHCEFCKKGLYNLCPSVVFFATPPYDGAFAEYVAHPAELCFKMPKSLGTMSGALIEPLAVGFHAAMQGGARVGMTAAVLGCGCIGLSTMLALKAMGVNDVYMSDVLDRRVNMANTLGATAYNAAETDVIRTITDTTGGGVDLVVETAGNARTIQDTVSLIKRGGRVVLVGLAPEPIQPFNVGMLIDKEAQVNTVFRYRNIYPMAISAVARGLNISGIVTDVFPFAEAQHALTYNVENKRDVVKAVISIP